MVWSTKRTGNAARQSLAYEQLQIIVVTVTIFFSIFPVTPWRLSEAMPVRTIEASSVYCSWGGTWQRAWLTCIPL